MPRAAALMLITTNCSVCPYFRISIFVHSYLPIQHHSILEIRVCDTEASRVAKDQFQTTTSSESRINGLITLLDTSHSSLACLDAISLSSLALLLCRCPLRVTTGEVAQIHRKADLERCTSYQHPLLLSHQTLTSPLSTPI
jgi:hypothetical protein